MKQKSLEQFFQDFISEKLSIGSALYNLQQDGESRVTLKANADLEYQLEGHDTNTVIYPDGQGEVINPIFETTALLWDYDNPNVSDPKYQAIEMILDIAKTEGANIDEINY